VLNYLKLENVGPSPKMEIDFSPRMNFLTGDNGLGKTFLLDIAWWGLDPDVGAAAGGPSLKARKTPKGTARGTTSIGFGYEQASGGVFQYESIFNRADQLWSVKRGRPAIAGAVIYAAGGRRFFRLGFCAYYWKEKEPEKPSRQPAFRFKPEEVWDGWPRDTPEKLCNGLILDWASWQRENGDVYSQLTRVLRALSPSPNRAIEARQTGANRPHRCARFSRHFCFRTGRKCRSRSHRPE